MIIMKVADAQSGDSVSGAHVRVRVHAVSDSTSSPPETIQSALELLGEEEPDKGVYRTAHRFEKSGKYDLTVTVRKMGEQTASGIAFTMPVEVPPPANSDRPEKADGFTRLAIGRRHRYGCLYGDHDGRHRGPRPAVATAGFLNRCSIA